MRFLLIIALLFFSLHASFAQEAENNIETTEKTPEIAEQVKLASPIGAMVRSAFVPGWGQFYSGSYYRGSLTVLGIGDLSSVHSWRKTPLVIGTQFMRVWFGAVFIAKKRS